MSVVSGPLTTGRPAGVSNTLYPTQAPTFYYKGAAVKAPRFRIAWVMVAVAIAALDFTAIRALLGPYTNSLEYQKTMLLLLGALPMANVLAVGMLIGQRRPASRPFLLGFEAFGAMALALSIALASCFPEEVVMHASFHSATSWRRSSGRTVLSSSSRSYVSSPWLCSAVRKWPSP